MWVGAEYGGENKHPYFVVGRVESIDAYKPITFISLHTCT